MTRTYCLNCGHHMEQRIIDGRTREVCSACGNIFYRNPVPAVGVVVTIDDDVVLVKRKVDPQAKHWALPAGYMELSESAEEAAIRECYEETNLQIRIDRLLGVYSFGVGKSSGLVIIYVGTIIGGELCASDDASDARAFPIDALPEPMAFCTHVRALERWRQQQQSAEKHVDMLAHLDYGAVVRLARRDDANSVLTLVQFLPRNDGYGKDYHVFVAAVFHERLNDPDRPILIAEVGGAPAGFATLSFHQTLRGWSAAIDDLAVKPEYRRQRIGQALVEAAVRLSQARNCHTLHLDTISGAPEAQAFYHACGFADGCVATLRVR